MGVSHEQAESKIFEKIQIYILTRAELLFTLCFETPLSLACHSTTANIITVSFQSEKEINITSNMVKSYSV